MRRHLLVPLTALTLALAACGGGDTTADDPGDTTTDTTEDATTDETADDDEMADDAAAGGSVTFVGTDNVTWESDQLAVPAGSVEVTIECGGGVPHGIGIDGVQDGAELAACDAGGQGSASVELEAGEYTFFCTVPGHRDAGMEGTLTVG